MLLKLIGFFTNLFFFQRVETTLVSPAGHHLGPFVILIPVAGALIVGVMARYGSEKIRGHGIPEAIEAILMNGSRVEPKVALLKPISAAISIGSGGPFGAEGPIIMTGGAFGSLIAQFFHLTSAERKTLLVAGAAAGMSATFAAPVASVLLAVELLLFEWKPRSLIPVALASVTAGALRRHLLGMGPLFPVPAHPASIGRGRARRLRRRRPARRRRCRRCSRRRSTPRKTRSRICRFTGCGGRRSAGSSSASAAMIFPQALGVGYDVIGSLLQGDTPLRILVGVLVVKSIDLGGLARLRHIGRRARAAADDRRRARRPRSARPAVRRRRVLAAREHGRDARRHDAVAAHRGRVRARADARRQHHAAAAARRDRSAHGFTVLLLKRSILTEKISRRGYHLSREYAIDPLEIIFAREVVRTGVVALPADATPDSVAVALNKKAEARHQQRLFPVIDEARRLVGVVTRGDLREWLTAAGGGAARPLGASIERQPVVAYADEPLRIIVFRMAETGLTRLPVVSRQDGTLVGMLALTDLLTARSRVLEAEQRRERVFGTKFRLPAMFGGRARTHT